MMGRLVTLWASVVLLALPACTPKAWVMVGGPYADPDLGFEAALPDGWRKANRAEGMLAITKDGLVLQRIMIRRSSIDEELGHTKKKISGTMLPQEVAEVVVDNIVSNAGISNPRVLENAPDRIDGAPGYRLLYLYETQGGLPVKGAQSGFVTKNWHYTITYEAPRRYYFDKYERDFEHVKQSFTLRGGD